MFTKLDGYKTYFILIIAFFCFVGESLGWIPWDTFLKILTLFGIGAGFTLRDAIGKVGKR
jgi:hypothetical protein